MNLTVLRMRGRPTRPAMIAVAALAALAIMAAFAAAASASNGFERSTYTPHHPSQEVDCRLVDEALSRIPHGDGIRPVTDEETGPGGWRYNGDGQSFATFAHTLVGDEYVVVAGRSNVRGNAGIINDYPEHLDLPQQPVSGAMTFKRNSGEIVLAGDPGDAPQFALPGEGSGQVRINMRRTGDGTFEGCAQTPILKNFGVVVPEGGDFVQREYFKAYAETDGDGVVTFFEWTEVSTFKNTDPEEN